VGAAPHALTTPAGAIAFAAALVWAPLTGFPTWPALARGRLAGAVALTGAVASFAFAYATCALGWQT
jgi:hypothetical protein